MKIEPYLLVDFGGPIVSDAGIENLRKTTVFRTAKNAGIIDGMSSVNRKVKYITESEIESAYGNAKSMLKKQSGGAEAYSDINRLAAAISLVIGEADYRKLLSGVSDESASKFWVEYCTAIREVTSESVQEGSLEAIRQVINISGARLSIVSDNWPLLFHKAFEPVIRQKFLEFGLPAMEYRVPSARRSTNNCIYVSGDGWGNKKSPDTWKSILGDLGISKNSTVFFVDDSQDKLSGFSGYVNTSGMKHAHSVHLQTGGESTKPGYIGIPGMKSLIKVVKERI